MLDTLTIQKKSVRKNVHENNFDLFIKCLEKRSPRHQARILRV